MSRLQSLTSLLVGMQLFFGWASERVVAQEAMDPDWPCIQVLVPTISAAVVWDGPSIEGLEARWRAQVGVARLVGHVTQRHVDADQAEQKIDAFAESQTTADRNAALTAIDLLRRDEPAALRALAVTIRGLGAAVVSARLSR